MPLNLPSRRIAASASSFISSPSPSFLLSCTRRRTLSFWGKGDGALPRKASDTVLTEEYLKRKTQHRGGIVRGSLASSSIFEDEELAGPKPKQAYKTSGGKNPLLRNPDSMAAALDPDPVGRKLWERRMVITDIKKRGRLTRTQLIKRQEREFVSRSQDIRGSVKKLNPLARQIMGKTVDEAIIQMRFSKKKAAIDLKQHLEYAKNQAIVKRGMGLGPVGGEKAIPMRIKTKDGKRLKVNDPTTMYVDQAWTGKGYLGLSPEYRARGRMNILRHRTSSITVILKEDKTRIRLHNEREEKIKNRKAWVQLPNRPITTQRQHYSW